MQTNFIFIFLVRSMKIALIPRSNIKMPINLIRFSIGIHIIDTG